MRKLDVFLEESVQNLKRGMQTWLQKLSTKTCFFRQILDIFIHTTSTYFPTYPRVQIQQGKKSKNSQKVGGFYRVFVILKFLWGSEFGPWRRVNEEGFLRLDSGKQCDSKEGQKKTSSIYSPCSPLKFHGVEFSLNWVNKQGNFRRRVCTVQWNIPHFCGDIVNLLL